MTDSGVLVRRTGLLLVVCLILAGCGRPTSRSISPPPVPTRHTQRPAPSPTSPAIPTSSPTSAPPPSPAPIATVARQKRSRPPTATATATAGVTPKPRATQGASPTPLPSPTPTAGPQPAAFVGASVAPATVPVGGSVTFTVSVYHASRVEIYLYSPASSAPSETVSLAASGHTWTAQSVAPSIAGTYHFSVGIFDRTGHRSLQDNNGWNLTVTAAPTPTAAPTLPDDIVLSPPFNWGNPTPVSFNALGQSVSGDEILSDVRSGVDPSGIYDFYNNRLPRAGWTVQGGATTAPTTAGFGITATKSGPGRVIVVLMQQSGTGYQVTVEYGPLPTSG